MERRDYLNTRFKNDFLRYSLLQEDSATATEIAERIYKVIDLSTITQKCKMEIARLLAEHLSFDKLKKDGLFSNELPSELEYGMQQKVTDEFQDYLKVYKIEEISENILKAILNSVEKLAWHNGITEMEAAIVIVVKQLQSKVDCYESMETPAMDESELEEKYNKAKENSFLERINESNIDDIIEYRNALSEYIEVKCINLLYSHIKEILKIIGGNSIFIQLQENFSELKEYSLQLKKNLPQLEMNAEWDAEYNKSVPTDFYFRNVEGITAEQAFHMVLLQYFAKNEEWMKENSMLVDGELRVYSNNSANKIKLLQDFLNKEI